eukprot:5559323-Prymnesium_polylepis.2
MAAALSGGPSSVLCDGKFGFWDFGGYKFRKGLRLGVEGGAATTAFVGVQVVATFVPPVGIALGVGAIGWGAVAAVDASSADAREAEELFEATYGFPKESLQSGKAWSTDWWDMEEGDGLLEMVLK